MYISVGTSQRTEYTTWDWSQIFFAEGVFSSHLISIWLKSGADYALQKNDAVPTLHAK